MRIKNIAVILVLLCAACDSDEKRIEQVFPGPGFEKGWSWKGMPEIIQPDDLADVYPEEAGIYMNQGLEETARVVYFWGSPEDTSFTATVFDLGSEENSAAVFEKLAEVNQVKADSMQFETAERIILRNERYVAELTGSPDSDKVRRGMRIIAEQLIQRIEEQIENSVL